MKIEFLYFNGCPNHKPALDLLQKILKEEAVNLPVNEIDVLSEEMATETQFLGSPSIRLGGKDIEQGENAPAGDYGIKCRMYLHEGRSTGIPPEEMIRRAIQEFKGGPN